MDLFPRARRVQLALFQDGRNWTSTMSRSGNLKLALIGGGGVRTPLVIFGINESAGLLGAEELALYDPDSERVRIMAELGRAIVAHEGGSLRIRVAASAEDAVADASLY